MDSVSTILKLADDALEQDTPKTASANERIQRLRTVLHEIHRVAIESQPENLGTLD
jgi:hypothetical protein